MPHSVPHSVSHSVCHTLSHSVSLCHTLSHSVSLCLTLFHPGCLLTDVNGVCRALAEANALIEMNRAQTVVLVNAEQEKQREADEQITLDGPCLAFCHGWQVRPLPILSASSRLCSLFALELHSLSLCLPLMGFLCGNLALPPYPYLCLSAFLCPSLSFSVFLSLFLSLSMPLLTAELAR